MNEEKKKRAGGQGVRSVKLEDVIIWYETSAQKGMQISTNRIHIKGANLTSPEKHFGPT